MNIPNFLNVITSMFLILFSSNFHKPVSRRGSKGGSTGGTFPPPPPCDFFGHRRADVHEIHVCVFLGGGF